MHRAQQQLDHSSPPRLGILPPHLFTAAVGTYTGGAEGPNRLVQGQFWDVTQADVKALNERLTEPRKYTGLLSAHDVYGDLVAVRVHNLLSC
jgi:hypothetical protein